MEGFNAADAREVSCAWLAEAQRESEKIEGDRLFRVYAGYDRVVQFLSTGLGDSVEVELSTVVRSVKWGKEGVVVEAVGGGVGWGGECGAFGAAGICGEAGDHHGAHWGVAGEGGAWGDGI